MKFKTLEKLPSDYWDASNYPGPGLYKVTTYSPQLAFANNEGKEFRDLVVFVIQGFAGVQVFPAMFLEGTGLLDDPDPDTEVHSATAKPSVAPVGFVSEDCLLRAIALLCGRPVELTINATKP